MPTAKLLLVGGGCEEARLKEQVARLGLEPHGLFAGRVPHAEVERYYGLVDLLVYPRRSIRLTELVTPLKPLEAMAQGRLLIASNVGGHRELIRDGETGFLFESDNAEALADAVRRVVRPAGTGTTCGARGVASSRPSAPGTPASTATSAVYGALLGSRPGVVSDTKRARRAGVELALSRAGAAAGRHLHPRTHVPRRPPSCR